MKRKKKKKRRLDLFFIFSQAPGDFLIDFQGYVSNLFFRYGGRVNERVNVFQAISLNSVSLGSFAWDLSDLLPSPSVSHLLPLLDLALFLCSLSPWKEGGDINPPKSMYFQTGCLRWQHRSLATIKTFALPDRLFLFRTLYALEWITGAC